MYVQDRHPGMLRAMKNIYAKTPIAFSLFLCCSLAGCGGHTNSTEPAAAAPVAKEPPPPAGPTPQDAAEFAQKTNQDLKALWSEAERASWVSSTYITDDTEMIASKAGEKVMAYNAAAIKDSTAFADLELDPNTERMLNRLRLSSNLPAPNDADKRSELASAVTKMGSMYGKGKWCPEGVAKDSKDCQDLGTLSKTLRDSQDYEKLKEAWLGWRTISPDMRPFYERYIALGNEGANEIGYENLGHLWKSKYDMAPSAFEGTLENLWLQVRPLYQELHCYARGKLSEQYPEKFDAAGPVPAHLFGNMWAQDWSNIYPMLEPYKGKASIDVTKALVKKKYDAKKMVELGEAFFTSLGMTELPDTFWERSMLTKPRDREVVCHASAWDVTYEKDVRIKMCIEVNEEDLITIHHELGHIYYYLYYYNLPVLYQDGAHDGFHEAIGDALALSVTPGYLKKIGILDKEPKGDEGLINVQMKMALDKIAFLPFGRMIDQWRWDVFSGKVAPENMNAHWWKMRQEYQGVMAPEPRTEANFDPGAKYHIPGNVPYVRYFLAFILQFQFHQAMCDAAGHNGPLHTCSIHDSKEAGKKLKAMLEMGASKAWPEALMAMTGTREMDASALLAYFAPLKKWLSEQNKDRQCGW
jgi:peptidyl-dipeptidase A